jgi:hypothetical protein
MTQGGGIMGNSCNELKRKQVLSIKILTDFNNAFQSIIHDYTHNLPAANKQDTKTRFKRRFTSIAEEANTVCNKIHGEKKDINPHATIRKILNLIKSFTEYPARNRSIANRLFSCAHKNNNSFGTLFHKRIVEYHDYLRTMIDYTCDDDSERKLSPYEIDQILDFITNNTLDKYRKHALKDPLLRANFQIRETLIDKNDTVGALSQINPEIPNLQSRSNYQPLR